MNNTLRNLGDAATVTMGLSPNGDSYNRDGTGIPLLNGPTEFGVSHPNCTLFTIDSKRECERGDLIFCVRGNTTGRMNWADRKYSLGRGVCGIHGETSRDTKYIRYCIEEGLPKLLQMAGGSTMPTLTQSTIKQFPIPYPSHRGKIAFILSAYDDLIENNMRRIRILEEMAQNLYREWFVKFRFPGHENAHFVDGVPEGWRQSVLSEVSSNYDRLRKPLSKMQRSERQGIYPYYGAAKIFDYIDDYLFDGVYLLVAEDGSVVTPERRPVLQYVSGRFWANNHTHIIQGKQPISTEFLYLMLSNFDISGYITGAAQPKINQANLNRIPVLVPNDELLIRFDTIVADIFCIKIVLQRKNDTLRQTRDLLLPRLISGEIDVSELDITVEENIL